MGDGIGLPAVQWAIDRIRSAGQRVEPTASSTHPYRVDGVLFTERQMHSYATSAFVRPHPTTGDN